MQMKYRLSGAGTNVVHGPVSVFDAALAANLRRHQIAVADDLGIFRCGILQIHNMPLGNDEHVRRRLGIDIFEGVDLIVFVNLLRGNLTGDDLAEEAIVHDISGPDRPDSIAEMDSAKQVLVAIIKGHIIDLL